MPQTTQIIPKWTFPHVETYINDYTEAIIYLVIASFLLPFSS